MIDHYQQSIFDGTEQSIYNQSIELIKTLLDAPETVYYVRRKFAEWRAQGIPCKIYYPEMSFWSLCLKKKMLPSRIARFC